MQRESPYIFLMPFLLQNGVWGAESGVPSLSLLYSNIFTYNNYNVASISFSFFVLARFLVLILCFILSPFSLYHINRVPVRICWRYATFEPCGSGMFIPDPGSDFSILDPGSRVKKDPWSWSAPKNCFKLSENMFRIFSYLRSRGHKKHWFEPCGSYLYASENNADNQNSGLPNVFLSARFKSSFCCQLNFLCLLFQFYMVDPIRIK